jgi:hypothetical protein
MKEVYIQRLSPEHLGEAAELLNEHWETKDWQHDLNEQCQHPRWQMLGAFNTHLVGTLSACALPRKDIERLGLLPPEIIENIRSNTVAVMGQFVLQAPYRDSGIAAEMAEMMIEWCESVAAEELWVRVPQSLLDLDPPSALVEQQMFRRQRRSTDDHLVWRRLLTSRSR